MELVPAIVLGDQIFQAMVEDNEPTNRPALCDVEGRFPSNKYKINIGMSVVSIITYLPLFASPLLLHHLELVF